MPQPARSGYDRIAIALHWLMAAAVLGQIALGWWMLDVPKAPAGVRAGWFNLHKSIGLTLGALLLLRLGWRLSHPPPALPPMPLWQQRGARISHALMYACLLLMPLAGYLGSTFSGYPIRWFGIVLPGWGWKDEALKDAMSAIHYGAAWLLMALVALHIVAALKHLLIDRDAVFGRMLPRHERGSARDQGA